MTDDKRVGTAIIGAGIAGIATAYYLCTRYGESSVLLIDNRQPMSYTSAQSGDNYRNWWPSPTMTQFTNDSIDLMEEIARESDNVLMMNRRGYVLATRSADIDELVNELHTGYGESAASLVRIQNGSGAYSPPITEDWMSAPDGVDVMTSQALIRKTFPALSQDIRNVVHIRRGGDISGQQLGAWMLERVRDAGGRRLRGMVKRLETGFRIDVQTDCGDVRVHADRLVNAAGPLVGDIAAMLGIELPVSNIFEQKIAFDDVLGAVPRDQPFSIDLDEQVLDFTDEERAMLREEPDLVWLTEAIHGGAHCRPEGGDHGSWVKLGWAYNHTPSEPQEELANEPLKDDQFPEIVMRGISRLVPSLGDYIDQLPARRSHYGGYYTMTPENWPLVGPLDVDGAYVVGALSGFGSMSACAAGKICAEWVTGSERPVYANDLSLRRYEDHALMRRLGYANKGLL